MTTKLTGSAAKLAQPMPARWRTHGEGAIALKRAAEGEEGSAVGGGEVEAQVVPSASAGLSSR